MNRRRIFGLLFAMLFAFTSNRLSGQQPQQSGTTQESQASQAAPTTTRAPRARVSQSASVSLLIKRVNPEYPKELKKRRIQGMVLLKVMISKDGDVTEVATISGRPDLAALASDAVRQWKYKPYLLSGQPVEVETTVGINFTLSER